VLLKFVVATFICQPCSHAVHNCFAATEAASNICAIQVTACQQVVYYSLYNTSVLSLVLQI